jgi:hypothetical protein
MWSPPRLRRSAAFRSERSGAALRSVMFALFGETAHPAWAPRAWIRRGHHGQEARRHDPRKEAKPPPREGHTRSVHLSFAITGWRRAEGVVACRGVFGA